MLLNMGNGAENSKDSALGIGILEQTFTQLSAERKFLLQEYLQNLVSMQNTMAGAISADSSRTLSNRERALTKRRCLKNTKP
jgi:hypothetical protein